MLEKIINDLLSQLGTGSKESVYLSVTPGVGLELIQIDPSNKVVKAYGHKPLEYSDLMRQIANYDAFKEALKELFSELNINPRCNVILNLPLVYFGKIELPLLLADDSVTEAVVSEVEQSYIFKRSEPLVKWFEAGSNPTSDTRTIFYSAVQKEAIDKIKDILGELGVALGAVEVSLTSILRALSYSGLTETYMREGTSWNLMSINSTGYSVLAMSGMNIVDYYEEPLALKTYELDEIYDAISASAQIALMNYPTNYLYIVSTTDMVSAEHLISKLQVEGTVDFFDDNSFRKREILPVNLEVLPDEVMSISLEAVGIGVSKIHNYPIKMDFSGNKTVDSQGGVEQTVSFNFNGNEIVLTETVMRKIVLVIGAILIVPALITMLVLPPVLKNKQNSLKEINSQIQTTDAEIKKLTEQTSDTGTFVVKTEIEKVLKQNRTKLMSFSAIGESVPKNLWITYFSTKSDGKVDIKGEAESVEDIYIFFKNMKNYLFDTQLRLYKLEMQSDSLDDAVLTSGPAYYEFEITNMSEAELNPPPPEEVSKKGKGKNAAAQSDDEQSDTGKSKSKSKSSSKNKKNVEDLEPVDLEEPNEG